ncbi:uncharacterized protein LOC110695829 [Chenopodium quinoa]|uniref:uncharacterized protein LOC110695829 n=1 Tax=Chenopodium quinoa TaxID=63459 RepID=UPI000B79843C|nr:uncharacterized protein LOC110695829 [Chenopodium quinoa]
MYFLLTSLNVAYVISTPRPNEHENETLESVRERSKWDNDDFICRGHILNGMEDDLFDVYQNIESAKELWESLESKYMAEDASSKKFLVSNFNNFKFVDGRSIMDQFHELQRIYGSLEQHGIAMNELFVVSSIIDKLPPSWKNVKHDLKHKKEDMTLSGLATHLQIEEGIRVMEGAKEGNPSTSTVNMDDNSWWIDSGASRHVCKSKHWFKTFQKVVDGEDLYMGNNSTIKVIGRGQFELVFSSGTAIILRNILYAPKISRNLVFGPTLNSLGYKIVFEANRCIITRGVTFIGCCYLDNGLFKPSLKESGVLDYMCLNVVDNDNQVDLNLFDLWH